MLRGADVMAWLKTLFPEVPAWGNGAINKNKPEIVGVYARRNGKLQPRAVGQLSHYGIKAVTILIHWGKYATPCEEKAILMFETLQKCSTNQQIGGLSCWVDARQAPVMIGKDDLGYFEAVIDFDIYFRKD